MLFTREPIIETVITPRSGYRLAVRSSKSVQEEILVDAVEIVSFGTALFFRCSERPKAFLLPCSDYEVSEVRETRLVLKHMAGEGKSDSRPERESRKIQKEASKQENLREDSSLSSSETVREDDEGSSNFSLAKNEKRRDRRRSRRRKGDSNSEESAEPPMQVEASSSEELVEETEEGAEGAELKARAPRGQLAKITPQVISALIPPPMTLVSDVLRYEKIENRALQESVKANKNSQVAQELIKDDGNSLPEQEAPQQEASQEMFKISYDEKMGEARGDFMETLGYYSSDDLDQS